MQLHTIEVSEQRLRT